MSRPDDETRTTQFLDQLREQGNSAGNYAMITALGWTESEYWRIREKLLADGRVAKGKGKGGSVRLVEQQTRPPSPPLPNSDISAQISRESDLYLHCVEVLRSHWAKVQDLEQFHANITANAGSVNTGGVWTRPDISGISMRVFPNWPGRYYDLWTFEIKPTWQFNPMGIFEAAAHARRATHAWTLYHVTEIELKQHADIDRMTEEAERLGIGMIFFTEPSRFESWDIKVDSVRQNPDPRLLEEFISIQLSDEAKANLARWSKA